MFVIYTIRVKYFKLVILLATALEIKLLLNLKSHNLKTCKKK